MKNTLSRTITGGIMTIAGLVLIIIGFFFWFLLIYGIPLLILGLIILFNKKEGEIEQIKSNKVNLKKNKK